MTWPRAAILLVCLVLTTFGQALGYGLTIWDDGSTISSNARLVSGFAGLLAIWREPQGSLYIPITYSAWWAVAQIFGVKAWAFHALNLVCHLTATLGVLAVLRRMGFGVWAGLWGAAIFAVHPFQSEAVAWASGGKDVLCGALMVWAIYAHLTRRPACYFLLLMAALLVKPVAVVVPVVVLLMDVWAGRRETRTWLTACCGVTLGIVAAWLAREFQPAGPAAIPLAARPGVAIDALGWYVRALTGGVRLCVDLGRTPDRARPWLGLVTLVIGSGIVALARDRRSWLGGGIAGVALAPYLGLLPFEFQVYSTVAAHYAYFAMFGVAILVAAFAEGGMIRARHRRGSRPVAAAAVALLAWRASAEATAFHDDETLFGRVMAVNRQSWAGPSNMAAVALIHGDAPLAERWARAALNVKPVQAGALITLGAALERQDDDVGAEQAFRAAVRANPALADAWAVLGTHLARAGRDVEGEVALRRAMTLDPALAEPHASLGVMLAHRGELDAAGRQLQAAVDLRPGDLRLRAQLTAIQALLRDAAASRRSP